jgi:hypothetical protein
LIAVIIGVEGKARNSRGCMENPILNHEASDIRKVISEPIERQLWGMAFSPKLHPTILAILIWHVEHSKTVEIDRTLEQLHKCSWIRYTMPVVVNKDNYSLALDQLTTQKQMVNDLLRDVCHG